MTPPTHDAPDAALARFLGAVEGADLDTVRATYHPDAVIWHSNDQVEQSVDENLATLGWIVKHLPGMRYTNVRRMPFPGGVVQQHDTYIPHPSGGEPLVMPACLVVRFDDDGRITRLDEYIDSSDVARLIATQSER